MSTQRSQMDEFSFYWLDKFKEGDNAAFHQFYKLTINIIKGWLYNKSSITTSEDEREELIANAYCKVFENREKMVDFHHANSWLFVCVRNKIIDKLRERRSYKNYVKETLYVEKGEHDPFESTLEERFPLLRQAMKKLSFQRQMVMYYSFVEGLSPIQIARKIGLARQTVLNHRNEAIKFIRKEMGTTSKTAKHIIIH